MASDIRKRMVLMLLGTSLTAGRLATPPYSWDNRLMDDLRGDPACKGPLTLINIGAGGTTSDFGASQSALYAPMRPTHLLFEDFAINDCAIGPVSLAQAAANFDTIVANFQAANPGIVMVHQTMSPASAGDGFRGQLATYYAQGTAKATQHNLLTIDNYAGWPKPLDPAITVNNDGLHPNWDAAFVLYSYPNILAWAKQAMAAFWP